MTSLLAFRPDPAAPSGARDGGTQLTGRLRLGVVQVLVLTLFVTLLVRLWYLQVSTGDDYQAQAADQSVREIVVQPARGLVVDDITAPTAEQVAARMLALGR